MVASVAENIVPSVYQAWQIYHNCVALLHSIAAGTAETVETAVVAVVGSVSSGRP